MKTKMVNANPDTIEAIYFKKDWQKILKLRNNVRIPTANPLTLDNYIHDQPDSVWEIIDRDGIKVHDHDSYLNRIQENPSSVLDNPGDIYFVDRKIKKNYLNDNVGVLITAQKSASAIPLKTSWEKVLRKGENFSWDTFFRSDVINKIIPSNSLILVDRYMFSKFDDGVQNLMDILDAILPATMNGDYHVLVITDEDQVLTDGTQGSPDAAAHEMQCVVPSLDRPYRIILEVVMVKTLGKLPVGYRKTAQDLALMDFYADTHDRHIISNYFIVSADHALCAVRETKNGNLVASFKQTLKFESLYAGIDNKFQDLNSLPAKSCDDFIKSVRRFTSSTAPRCSYYINAKAGDVSKIRNRLLI